MNKKDKVFMSLIHRYGELSNLKLAMYECEDTVLVNIADDLEHEIEEEEILTIIKDLLR